MLLPVSHPAWALPKSHIASTLTFSILTYTDTVLLLEATIRRMKVATHFLVDTLLLLTPKAKPHRHPALVLIIRLDAIGDFVLWLHAAQATVTRF